jgi:NADH-quinone oxidoreductase subunit A
MAGRERGRGPTCSNASPGDITVREAGAAGSGFFRSDFVTNFTKWPDTAGIRIFVAAVSRPPPGSLMDSILPVLLFVVIAAGVSVGLLVFAELVGPRRAGAVKEMPYESGMDPIHDTRRRFDVRFHLVAITFLVFDVELLFLYPWAVASRHSPPEGAAAGVDAAVAAGLVSSRGLVFGAAMAFIALVVVGFAYDWRKGVFRWR